VFNGRELGPSSVLDPVSLKREMTHPRFHAGQHRLLLAALALALLALLPTHGVAAVSVAWRVALCGVGFALFSAPNVRILIAAAPTHRTAAAGAMIAISRQIGQTLGAALAGVLLAKSAGTAGPRSFALAAFIALAAAGLSLLRSRRSPSPTAS
jgi:MFS transporter, DHA2 family, multidrug resistance protein